MSKNVNFHRSDNAKTMNYYFNISTHNWYFHLVIGILLFLLFMWIIGRLIKKRKYQISLSIVLTLGFTPVVYSFVVMIFFTTLFFEYHPNSKFDHEEWIENVQDRHEMRKDIIESEILIGKTKTETIEILGKPITDIKMKDDTLKQWTYHLGSEGHGFGWKFHQLKLIFKNGKVDMVEHIEHID